MVTLHDTRGLSSADGGMTVGLWKTVVLDGRRPPWYRPLICRGSDIRCDCRRPTQRHHARQAVARGCALWWLDVSSYTTPLSRHTSQSRRALVLSVIASDKIMLCCTVTHETVYCLPASSVVSAGERGLPACNKPCLPYFCCGLGSFKHEKEIMIWYYCSACMIIILKNNSEPLAPTLSRRKFKPSPTTLPFLLLFLRLSSSSFPS